jgi:hemoglobin
MGQVVDKDIENADDIAKLVREFYARVYQDEILRPLFADVARVDLEQHLPKMNRFWGTVLLGEQSYRGNPMKVHHALNALQPLEDQHFERWLSLFRSTVDRLFQGPRAERAKESARRVSESIAWTLQRAKATPASCPPQTSASESSDPRPVQAEETPRAGRDSAPFS